MAKKKSIPQGSGQLTLLGKKRTAITTAPDSGVLESFANPCPNRDYVIQIDCPEFTALCPITSQPDFGTISVNYKPRQLCLESKSLKLYLHSFRNCGMFYEDAVNRILDDLARACRPRQMQVCGVFNARGGISFTVTAQLPGSAREKTS